MKANTELLKSAAVAIVTLMVIFSLLTGIANLFQCSHIDLLESVDHSTNRYE